MLKQDYVMRLIEKMGQLLARLERKRQDDAPQAALELLQTSGEELFGIDLALVDLLDHDSLLAQVRNPAEIPHLARLLRHQADTLRQLGRTDEATTRAVRALALFAAAERNATLDPHHGFDDDIVHLLTTTPPEHIDPAILAALTPA